MKNKNKITGSTPIFFLISFFSFAFPAYAEDTIRNHVRENHSARVRETHRGTVHSHEINMEHGKPGSTTLSKKVDSINVPAHVTPESGRTMQMKVEPNGGGTSIWYPDGAIALGEGSVVDVNKEKGKQGQEMQKPPGDSQVETLPNQYSIISVTKIDIPIQSETKKENK